MASEPGRGPALLGLGFRSPGTDGAGGAVGFSPKRRPRAPAGFHVRDVPRLRPSTRRKVAGSCAAPTSRSYPCRSAQPRSASSLQGEQQVLEVARTDIAMRSSGIAATRKTAAAAVFGAVLSSAASVRMRRTADATHGCISRRLPIWATRSCTWPARRSHREADPAPLPVARLARPGGRAGFDRGLEWTFRVPSPRGRACAARSRTPATSISPSTSRSSAWSPRGSCLALAPAPVEAGDYSKEPTTWCLRAGGEDRRHAAHLSNRFRPVPAARRRRPTA